MPVFIFGPVVIGKVEGDATVQFGDTKRYSPSETTNSVSGQGSENSGASVVSNNGINEDSIDLN